MQQHVRVARYRLGESGLMSTKVSHVDHIEGTTVPTSKLPNPLPEPQLVERFTSYLSQDLSHPESIEPLDVRGVPDVWMPLAQAMEKLLPRLRDYKQAFQHEIDTLSRANSQLSSQHELLSELAVEQTSAVVVIDSDTRKPIMLTETAEWFAGEHPRLASEIAWTLVSHSEGLSDDSIHWTCEFLTEGANPLPIRLSVTSHAIKFSGRAAVAHIISEDTREQAEEEQRLEELAYRDPLTGLYNRRYGMMAAEKLVAEEKPFSLAFIDMDNLKFSNDTFGHGVGDDYILSVTKRLRSLPQPRTICRIGGDEFLIIAEGQSARSIVELLKHMNHDMLRHLSAESILPYRSLSYGVVEVPVHPSTTLNVYLAQADSIMYGRKQRHKVYMEAKAASSADPHRLDTHHRRAVNVSAGKE